MRAMGEVLRVEYALISLCQVPLERRSLVRGSVVQVLKLLGRSNLCDARVWMEGRPAIHDVRMMLATTRAKWAVPRATNCIWSA